MVGGRLSNRHLSADSQVEPPPHEAAAAAVAAACGVDPEVGLSAAEAALRLAAGGPNELDSAPGPSVLRALLEALSEAFVLMLIAAALLAMVLGEARDGLLILMGVVPIVAADVATTYRAERALEVLRLANAPRAYVRRDGSVIQIPAREVVVGDVVVLRSGDVVPADVRVSRGRGLLVDRSLLTGESVPEPVSTDPDQRGSSLTDRRSMAYAQTGVVGGLGEGVAVAVGMDTEVGAIARTMTETTRPRSPLERELARLVRILLTVAGGLVVITVGLGFARGHPAGQNILAGVAAAIAAIPEEPPILLAVILGLGAYRLLRRDVLVRRLNAQETLGAVDLILTDKTGTLTVNRLSVASVHTPDGPVIGAERVRVLGEALRAEADAWQLERAADTGAFARAIRDALIAEGGVPVLAPADLVHTSPATSARPFATTRCVDAAGMRDIALGAPEAVLDLVRKGTTDEPTIRELARWDRLVGHEAGQGGRLLVLATRTDGRRWRPLAALVFADPLRDEIPEAVSAAAAAGIQVVMVTGDHPDTARAIGRGAGLDGGSVLLGAEVRGLGHEALEACLPGLQIVARATPSDKLLLVEAAEAAGRTVAVTGDGVNDAPALQRADVAVAMGSGTAVAKEAADLVLGDDSFATLMAALREGRRMIANVQKGLVFLLSTHVALLGYILVATVAGLDLPLLPIQILWAEFFIDISAAVAFEREGAEPTIMTRPPRRRGVPLLDRRILAGICLAGGFSALAALAIALSAAGTPQHVSWVAFTTLVVAQLVRANANRTLEMSLLELRPNALLAGMGLAWLAIQVAIPYLPPLAEAFRASPLSAAEWAAVAAVALLPTGLAELMRRRGHLWVA
jgi:Ca2+-transporting ATPase